MNARAARLDEVCEINPRMPKGLAEHDVISFLPMAAVSEDGHIDFEEERQIKEVKKGYTYFERGDVLVAKITPCFENGKATRTSSLAKPIGFGSTEFHVLRAGAEVDSSYLFHMVWNSKFRDVGANNMTGSAGQKRVPADFLKRLEIPLPPLDEQRRIAAILDKADALRRKIKRALDLLDILTQSIFIKIFGDPVSNPKGWKGVQLGDLIHKASDGPHVSPTYSASGVPFLSTRHILKGVILWEDLKFVDQEQAEFHWKKCKPKRGDILYTKGGTTGLAAAVNTDEPFAIWVHLALLKLDHDKVDPIWLESMLNSDYCYQQSQRYTHGIANRDLGLKRMVKIRMFLPPMQEQQRFAEAISVASQIKLRLVEQALKEESLFASLQHRAFSGQL
ncbi:MAG TPA: restriction endonuclease subunit S [Aliidongia sp.]|nr:restriction endonuclease subunit S [Aliidongia sp.]